MNFVRDFNRDGGGRGRGGRDFNRDSRGGGFDRPQMFEAICSNCGKTCEVPFKPNGSKPVFCRECFQANRNAETGRAESFPPRRPDFAPPPPPRPVEQNYRNDFQTLNIKIDKILNLLEAKQAVKKEVVTKPVEPVIAPEVDAPVVPIIKKRKPTKKPAAM